MPRRAGPRASTITDVARRAGVSIKTVSRVLNGEPYVTEAMRERIVAAIAELGYTPNASARSLSSTRSYLLGLFFDDPGSGYASAVQLGAINRCRERGYHLVTERVDPLAADLAQDIARLATGLQLDGAVLTPPICDDPRVLEGLDAAETPYVRLGPDLDLDRSGLVAMDDEAAAFEMTAHLIGLGHSAVAFVKGDPAHAAAHRRWAGYRAALARHGLAERPDLVSEGDFSFRSGLLAAERLLAADPRPTAVFASNDDMALGVLATAGRMGVSVPAELSVAGFDDSPGARVVWPQLTTIRQPNYEMAATAVDMLVDAAGRRDRPEPASRRALLDFELVARASTDRAPSMRPPKGRGAR